MTAIVMDESFTSAKPAWRWIALLLLLLAAALIAMTVYGVAYECEAKMAISEAIHMPISLAFVAPIIIAALIAGRLPAVSASLG